MNFRAIIILLCLAVAASAQRSAESGRSAVLDTTAAGALKLLPADIAKRVARIEARGGTPWPSRWYVLVYEPAEPRGLREFVFADGRQVAARMLSQFADTLGAEDVIGAAAIKVNSDTAAGIAGQFALHNGVRLGSMDYELRNFGESKVPAWRLTCLNSIGDQLGSILIDAKKGGVISYDGFAKAPFEEPSAPAAPVAPPVVREKPAAAKAPPINEPESKKPAKPPVAKPRPANAAASPDRSVTKPFRADPTPKPGPIDRIGNSVRKVFGSDR